MKDTTPQHLDMFKNIPILLIKKRSLGIGSFYYFNVYKLRSDLRSERIFSTYKLECRFI